MSRNNYPEDMCIYRKLYWVLGENETNINV
jgi:hypothetical protein